MNLDITYLDVTTAFFIGFLKENVFTKQPEWFGVAESKNKVLKLKRAIYGLKQTFRIWNERVNDVLVGLGYKKSESKPCICIKNRNKLKTIVALYVDDFFTFSNDNVESEFLKKRIKFKISG